MWRQHSHVLLIVPLVVIAMTWPTLPELFNGDAFWLHTNLAVSDPLHRIWDAWHIGKVLSGQAEFWYTYDMYHPRGASLAFQHFSFPHAFLQLALTQVMPVDSVYNLLFMLILCFNGFSAYVLILHLVRDKWAALFGAVVSVLGISFSQGRVVPDLICIGTIPLTLYFFHRAFFEDRRFFAALAGICAGITAFIGIYNFGFILLSTAVYAAFLAPSLWRQALFWRLLLLFALPCAAIASIRIYPMVADTTVFNVGLARYDGRIRSEDLLDHFVYTGNPFTGGLLHSVFKSPPDAQYQSGYLGYINLFFLACALLRLRRRKRLLPWLALFVFFALMRQGDYLVINGVAYRDIVLPDRILSDIFPALFGQIGTPHFYFYGLVTPLALLSCFGLARLIHGRSARTRALVALSALLVLVLEFYVPLTGRLMPKGATTFVDWLKSEPDDSIKLINLPRGNYLRNDALYVQTLAGYPIAYGHLNRIQDSANAYVDRNLLLREWRASRSARCYKGVAEYQGALDELLAEGFSHVVFHRWHQDAELIQSSFTHVPAVYDDGLVSVYRLRDLRLDCLELPIELAGFSHFLEGPWGARRPGSALLSFHPRDPIDSVHFAYLDGLIANTTDWDGLIHFYLDQGEPIFQAAPGREVDADDFTKLDQIVYVVYHSRDADPALMAATPPLDGYHACGRQRHEDGSVIARYLRREFSCALFASPAPLQAQYDNGGHLANMLVALDDGGLELQIRWGALPRPKHAFSVQIFDAAGTKVHNQDFVIGDGLLARHRIDYPALPPGDYALELVVYDYETGRSASGRVGDGGERFERAWEFATINRK